MQIHVVTAFPNMFQGPLSESIIKRAKDKKLVDICIHDLRAFAHDKHHTLDDYPYGGGPGMILKAEPVFLCVEHIISEYMLESPTVIFTTPSGTQYNQEKAIELSGLENMIILCGHYKGIDNRIIEQLVTLQISIGDYILTGGELASLIICDATSRNIEGVLGNSESLEIESFETPLLEAPSFSKPKIYHGISVPSEYLKGNHSKIRSLKLALSECKTKFFRPEQLLKHRTRKSYEK